MSDESVAKLLRSSEQLVIIEASAGCGKTYQGASYAKDVVGEINDGRLLILTHTHAACSVFANRTKGASSRVEIKTIDALIGQIAMAYHKPLGLPRDVSTWAWQNKDGFELLAEKVASYLQVFPQVARSLAQRYPIIICDEHQDSTVHQHRVVLSLFDKGAKLRVFGDPLQRIYGSHTPKAANADRDRWETFKNQGACEKLTHPHRWIDGCPKLGKWIIEARQKLEGGQPIDLSGKLPASLKVMVGNNISMNPTGYQLIQQERRPIDKLVDNSEQLMVLASQNAQVSALRGFWQRTIPIWEGHTRTAFADLVGVVNSQSGNAVGLAEGLNSFLGEVAIGFSKSSHGNKLLEEIQAGAVKSRKGKPANIQAIAKCLLSNPSHAGLAGALNLIHRFVKEKADGFDGVKIDYYKEFSEGARMGEFAGANEAFTEISRKRSYSRSEPPKRVLSTIHKAKGLECDNVLLMTCDKSTFPNSEYSRCKLYVALSRAKKSLTLVIPNANGSPLFKLA